MHGQFFAGTENIVMQTELGAQLNAPQRVAVFFHVAYILAQKFHAITFGLRRLACTRGDIRVNAQKRIVERAGIRRFAVDVDPVDGAAVTQCVKLCLREIRNFLLHERQSVFFAVCVARRQCFQDLTLQRKACFHKCRDFLVCKV